MIVGIGIDTIEIKRFAQWHTWDDRRLVRVFSQVEIDYCKASTAQSAQRFAVRFAAREALFKALFVAFAPHKIPFLSLCRATTITRTPAPLLAINWQLIHLETHPLARSLRTHLSLSHSHTQATAFVVLESFTNSDSNGSWFDGAHHDRRTLHPEPAEGSPRAE